MKKDFKDTKIGKFISKLVKAAPELVPVAMEIVPGAKGVSSLLNLITALREKTVEVPGLQDLQFEADDRLQEFISELMALENEDRASARDREIQTAKARKTDWLQVGVGAVIAISFLTCLIAVLFFDIPGENRELVIHVISVIEGGFLGSMVPYYFGGSSVARRLQKPPAVYPSFHQDNFAQPFADPMRSGYMGE